MNMDKNEEKTYQPQVGRISQGSAYEPGIVPAGSTSSSDYGQGPALATSDGPENAIVEIQGEGGPIGAAPETKEEEINIRENEGIKERNINKELDLIGEEKDEETASLMYESAAMECEEVRATKRKKPLHADAYSTDESEDEALRRVKVSRKQKRITDVITPRLNKEQSRSDSDLSMRPSEEDERIIKMKRGYISKQKKLEIEEIKEEIAREKREENRRKKEEGIKIEEERRRKEEKIKAEKSIMAKISSKPIIEEEYIENMTASDLAAMALEYLDHIEIIRMKCGTMQGALSGELKRRKTNLDGMVRALQAKAEERGDPLFLKTKIDELIKKNRDEEVRRLREINDLKEMVNSLVTENKEMKRELYQIKEEMRNRDRENYTIREEKKYTYQGALDPTMVVASDDEGPVMRPPLKGKSVPIPNSALKQKKEIKINEEKEKGKKKKPDIKVKENIQIRPPNREIEVRGSNYKEDTSQKEEIAMEWDESGTGWNQEQEEEKDRKIGEIRNGNIHKEGKSLKETEERTWTEVVKKGKKGRKMQQEKKKETESNQARVKEIVRRK